MSENEYGALAAALAKAQAAFPPIPRTKEVTVTSDKGSYKFKYAPLDDILAATRKPLADNGLAMVQLLDSDAEGLPALVSMLLHESGGALTARTPIPYAEGQKVQVFGSTITYLRRYSIQALLGIAAEEDDDGNAAAGNKATFGARQNTPTADLLRDGLIGEAQKTDKLTGDFQLREGRDTQSADPDLLQAFIGFRLKDGSPSGFLCEAWGPLAEAMKLVESDVIGHRVQVWGRFVQRPLIKGGSYRAFVVVRIQTPTVTLPANIEAESVPLFSDDEQAGLDAAIGSAA